MFGVARLIFLFFTIKSIRTVSPVLIQELPTNDIIINIHKGYALRRIGTYSSSVAEQVVHTFIPLTDFCLASAKTDVCFYSSISTMPNVLELTTTMTSHHMRQILSTYNSKSVSKLIGEDISRVLAQHHPDQILRDTKSIVHFVNNQFHYQKNDSIALTAASSINTVNNYNAITRFRATPAERILKQIKNDKISFEYLSDPDLKLFLTAIFSHMGTSYTNSNVQESLNIFTKFIVGQSIYALRYCALIRENSLPAQPCLVVSTLFLQIPSDSISTHSIYRLIPLPIVFNDEKYVYSNLPKIIGINSIDQTLVMWNDEPDTSECVLSPIVLCQNKPVSTSLLKSSCLSQLFDDNQLSTTMCPVSRSQNIEQDIMRIDDGIWFFYNIRQPHYCQVYSLLNRLSGTITISEAAVVRMPCDKTITCAEIQLSASSCKEQRVLITPSLNSDIQNLPRFIVPIKNMTQTLVSSYQLQSDKSMKDLMTAFISKQPRYKRIMNDFASYVLSVVSFIFVIMFLYIFKLLKWNVPHDIKDVRSFVEDMIDV